MISYEEKFKSFLKEQGLKYTIERKEILKAIVKCKRHFDAEEIHQRLRKEKSSVSLATVYRTIPLLIQCGLIMETLHCREKVSYEKIHNKKHHDHLICIGCGKIIEFFNEEVESLQNEICRQYHFLPTEHRLGIKGYCQECQEKRKDKSHHTLKYQ